MPAEDLLRERLSALSAAAGLPVPPLEVDDDRKGHLSPAGVDRKDGVWRIVVAPTLLDAASAEQDWRLATALGWWASPEPRRRHNRSWLVYGAAAVPHFVVGALAMFGTVGLPTWVAVLAGPVLAVVLVPLTSALGRYEQRAFDAAGRPVLAAAGHDPVALTRAVFGGRTDPSWYRRPLAAEPSPSRRVADAEAWRPGPAPPLY